MNNIYWALSILVLFYPGAPVYADGHNSGFLDDYSRLSPDEGRIGAMVYRKDGASLANYDKIALAPIEIWISPTSKYKGLSPDDLKALADTFAAAIIKQLEPDYLVVGVAGDGVLRVRIAIANITLKKKKRGLLSFTPVGFALTTLKDIAGKRVILDNAVIEAELTDSKSGEILGLLVGPVEDHG